VEPNDIYRNPVTETLRAQQQERYKAQMAWLQAQREADEQARLFARELMEQREGYKEGVPFSVIIKDEDNGTETVMTFTEAEELDFITDVVERANARWAAWGTDDKDEAEMEADADRAMTDAYHEVIDERIDAYIEAHAEQ
jgi:hypothetical protein